MLLLYKSTTNKSLITLGEEFHTKVQAIEFIPDVYQKKSVSEQAHDHLQTLGKHNPITENRELYYKMRETFEGS